MGTLLSGGRTSLGKAGDAKGEKDASQLTPSRRQQLHILLRHLVPSGCCGFGGGGERVSRDPFPLEGPGYKAFMLSFPAPTAPQDPAPSATPPSLLPTHAPVLSRAPRRSVPLEQPKLRNRSPGSVGAWRKGCSGGLGKACLAGLLNLGAIRGSQPKPCGPRILPSQQKALG